MVADLLKKIFLPAYDAGADTSFKGGVDDVSESHESDDALLGAFDVAKAATTSTTTTTEGGSATSTSASKSLLQPFDTNIWTVNGPVVDFYGFDYPTRMVVIKMKDNEGDECAWLWSPVEYSKNLADEIIRTVRGTIKYVVSPNKIHWLYIKSWQHNFPNAKYYASPGLQERQVSEDIDFDEVLTDETPIEYSNEINQIIFQGGVLDEVIFFHKSSRTVIFCDLIQRHPIGYHKGFHGYIMKLEGVVGSKGSTPKEWIFCFWLYKKYYAARETLNTILFDWQPHNLIIAHGDNYNSHVIEDQASGPNAIQVIENCLLWIPLNPKEPSEGCICCKPSNSNSNTN